jgi:hypothetical protein
LPCTCTFMVENGSRLCPVAGRHRLAFLPRSGLAKARRHHHVCHRIRNSDAHDFLLREEGTLQDAPERLGRQGYRGTRQNPRLKIVNSSFRPEVGVLQRHDLENGGQERCRVGADPEVRGRKEVTIGGLSRIRPYTDSDSR